MVLVAMLPVPILLAVAQFWVADQLVPKTETALAAWWNSTTPPPEEDDDDATSTPWAHTGDGLAAFDQISADGKHITGLHLYRRGVDGQFEGGLDASSADWGAPRWGTSGEQ